MKVWTAHTHPQRPPVLVREGFSWAAFVFGPLWLLRHGTWIAAALAFALLVLVCTVPPPQYRPLLAFALFFTLGLTGHDVRRWSLGRGRFDLAHVVAARDGDEAFLRLLSHDPAVLSRHS